MSERQKLLWMIKVYGFALLETNLFLDTHPDDEKAIAFFNSTNQKKTEAVTAYTKKYGPITAQGAVYDKRFTWVDDPWPWEYGTTATMADANTGVAK